MFGSLAYAWDFGTLTSAADTLGADKLAEKAIIGKFVKGFKKDRPISTSLDDAYPLAFGIEDFKPRPVSKKIMGELKEKGSVSLRPGAYDFYLQSFCLHAGKYSPRKHGSGYLAAPLKGSKALVIRHLLENSSRHPDVSQHDVQLLVWAIESGSKYGDLEQRLRGVAEKLLSKEDIEELGKSFWDVLPKRVREVLFTKLKNELPEDIRDTLEVYDEISNKLNEAAATYEEIERIAVRLGEPPFGIGSKEINEGAWNETESGFFMRFFPSGYSQTRVQVYVPEGEEVSFSPSEFVAAPANTSCQRLGFREEPYMEPNIEPEPEEKKEVEMEYKEGEKLSNSKVVDTLQDLARKLGADKIEVSDGDRSREEHERIYDNLVKGKLIRPEQRVKYEKTGHGQDKGYIAADVRFYRDGQQIPITEVGVAAEGTDGIGGIGQYFRYPQKDFTHIDIRPRKPNGDVAKWAPRQGGE